MPASISDVERRPRHMKRNRPRIPHSVTHRLVGILAEYYQEHVRRNRADGSLVPSDTWQFVYGFLLAAHQTYDAVCVLLAHKRPQPLLLQAATLNRALFEYLANVCAILQDPESCTQELLRDAYRTNALVYRLRLAKFAEDEQWRDYFERIVPSLEFDVKRLQLPQDWIEEPTSIPPWPSPGRLIMGETAKVTGTARSVLDELYQSHYRIASAQAHGRGMATSMAIVVAHPEYQLADQASGYVTTAQVMLACLWTEVSIAAKFETNPKLLEYWKYMREYDAEAVDLWNLRYRDILSLT